MTALYLGKVSPAIFIGTEYRKISEISALATSFLSAETITPSVMLEVVDATDASAIPVLYVFSFSNRPPKTEVLGFTSTFNCSMSFSALSTLALIPPSLLSSNFLIEIVLLSLFACANTTIFTSCGNVIYPPVETPVLPDVCTWSLYSASNSSVVPFTPEKAHQHLVGFPYESLERFSALNFPPLFRKKQYNMLFLSAA